MKRLLIIFFPVLSLFIGFASCGADNTVVPNNPNVQNNGINNGNNNDTTTNHMKIKIGSKIFSAILLDNATATAFKAMLPITVTMSELNGNEKYFYLSTNLPTNASTPGTIHKAELMIWGSNCLVLFYKTFSTSYSYTKLARIEDTTDLAATVGSGSVTVTFELD